MTDFLPFPITNPLAASIVILLLITLISMFVVAFVQGREVALGPLKIGSKYEAKARQRGGTKDDPKVILSTSRTGYTIYRTNRLRSAQKIDDVSFGIYETDSKSSPPRVGFMIIGDKELLIAYSHKSIRLAIQHPEIVKLYSEYFEDIWHSAYKLKQGNKVDSKKLDRLENELQ